MNTDYVPDCIYQSDNDLEIPSLLLEEQPTCCEIPFVCYGEQKRTFQMQGAGTLHFYTDDYRFTALYEHPENILKHNPGNIVEPNFSLFEEMPIAFGMQAIYKKRFIARAMQERGIKVFVDLNVAPKWYKLNMMGVPMGYSCYCTRGYSDRIVNLDFEYEIATFFANGNRITFVVYGGGEVVKEWCRAHNAIYVAPLIALKNKIKAFQKIKESIAFGGQTLSVQAQIPTLDDLLKNQVQNFAKAVEAKDVE